MTGWEDFFKKQKQQPYFEPLMAFVEKEYSAGICYPPKEDIFRAFSLTSPQSIKAVIIGQDPYHGAGQAQGLCFSVGEGVKRPPSLNNIYKELALEYPGYSPRGNSLYHWAEQGVLMLNAVLTVREGQANSHKGKGWEQLTGAAISYVNSLNRPVVYLLWGNYAIKQGQRVTNSRQLVLTAAHPSPLSASRGFFGCNHFKKCNSLLAANGLEEINW